MPTTKPRQALIASLILTFSHCPLVAAEPPWGDLGEWVDKYPTDEQVHGKKRLLALAPVREKLRTLLDPADLRRLDKVYSIETPIEMIDNFIVVAQCMPHNCPGAHAMVVIDNEFNRMWVGFFERTKNSFVTRWYGTDDYSLLPQAVLDRFRRSHSID